MDDNGVIFSWGEHLKNMKTNDEFFIIIIIIITFIIDRKNKAKMWMDNWDVVAQCTTWNRVRFAR